MSRIREPRSRVRDSGLPTILNSAGQRTIGIGARAAFLALLAVLGLSATGCAKGTYLEVRFTGPDNLPPIYALTIALTLTPPTNDGGHSIGTVDAGTIIKLPTSIAFQLDNESGALRVDASALDVNGRAAASGSANTTIMHAKTWTLTVNLTPI